MKRSLAIILTVLMVMSIFAGCGSQPAGDVASSTPPASDTTSATPEASKEPAKKVEIQFLHGQPEEPRVKAIQSIIDAFVAENPNVVMTQMPVPEEGFWTKITTLMSTGDLPAIVEGGVDQLRLMNAEEALDLSANTAAIEAIGKDRYFAGALEMAKAPGGEYLGVPVSGWVSGIWYRKSLFAEKGLAAPDSWENILAAAKALHDPANKKYGILFATEESDFTEQTFSHYALSNQALLFDANGNPQFTSPAMKEAVQMYKDLYQYTLPGSNGVDQVKDAFVGGHAAMAMYSTYIMGALQEQGVADDIGFAIPKNKVEAGFGMTSTMTISNMIDADQREAAIKFVASMGNKESNITWCHMSAGGSNPVLKDVASDANYLDHPVLKAFGETAAKVPQGFDKLQMLGFQNGEPHAAMGTITGKFIIPRCLNQVLVQGKDIDAAMAEAQKALEEEVAAAK